MEYLDQCFSGIIGGRNDSGYSKARLWWLKLVLSEEQAIQEQSYCALLAAHPNADVVAITSRAEKGVAVAKLYPNLRGVVDLDFVEPDIDMLASCDLVFFATPHGVAQRTVPAIMATGTKVIDLSADFRIRDIAVWEQWYGQAHAAPELVENAVYGLPEYNRSAIADADLVACPGCYPTAVQLGFMPLLQADCVDTSRPDCQLRIWCQWRGQAGECCQFAT